MRRSLLYITAAGFVLALLVLVFSITTSRPSAPPCPLCGSHATKMHTLRTTDTLYVCPACNRYFTGPPRQDFSWADAAREWLGE